MTTPELRQSSRVWVVWLGAVLIGCGLVAGALSVFNVATHVGGTIVKVFSADVYPTPMSTKLDLDEGTYLVYELTETSRSFGPLSSKVGHGVTISVSDVNVISSAGAAVPVEPASLNETVNRGSDMYTGAVKFHITSEGSYLVTVRTPNSQVMVAPSIATGFRDSFGWLAFVALSALLVLVGAVVLILGLVHRHRREPANAPMNAPVSTPVGPPAGWYSDPTRQSNWRWWDGRSWSDRTG